MNANFCGFVITCNRRDILPASIGKIFSQQCSPQILLIVDNDEGNCDPPGFSESAFYSRLTYHKVGYNSGPAGAAHFGLNFLANRGYDWIYWGDDDDPPEFGDEFEELLTLTNSPAFKDVGILGVAGHRFNKRTGEVDRTTDDELIEKPFIEVDSVAGNQCMLVNAEVVRRGILPDPDLFFGFEELDFCLRVRKAGYRIVIPSKLFRRARLHHGRSGISQPFYIRKEFNRLHRQYYSTRNLLIILRKHRLWLAFARQSAKAVAKMIYGFRFGIRYGVANFKAVGIGTWHGILNITGKKY